VHPNFVEFPFYEVRCIRARRGRIEVRCGKKKALFSTRTPDLPSGKTKAYYSK